MQPCFALLCLVLLEWVSCSCLDPFWCRVVVEVVSSISPIFGSLIGVFNITKLGSSIGVLSMKTAPTLDLLCLCGDTLLVSPLFRIGIQELMNTKDPCSHLGGVL